MRPMLVVVFDVVADEAFELAAVPDDGAVENKSRRGGPRTIHLQDLLA